MTTKLGYDGFTTNVKDINQSAMRQDDERIQGGVRRAGWTERPDGPDVIARWYPKFRRRLDGGKCHIYEEKRVLTLGRLIKMDRDVLMLSRRT